MVMVLILQARKALSGVIILNFQFTPDLSSSDNILAQCYNYLKSLEEFKNAVDV